MSKLENCSKSKESLDKIKRRRKVIVLTKTWMSSDANPNDVTIYLFKRTKGAVSFIIEDIVEILVDEDISGLEYDEIKLRRDLLNKGEYNFSDYYMYTLSKEEVR